MSSNYKLRPNDENISYIETLMRDPFSGEYKLLFKTFIDNERYFFEISIGFNQWDDFFDGDGMMKMDRKIRNYEMVRDFIKIKKAEKIYNHYNEKFKNTDNMIKKRVKI